MDVVNRLRQNGHIIVGIFTILDKGKREDPLGIIRITFAKKIITNFLFTAKCGNENGIPVYKIKAWRKSGKYIPEIFDLYKNVNADLNVLPYCSQFIPMEVINYPRLKSICYHPSILPRHRGASAINW